ncbi:hypothetical protein A2685_03070 [Candidatus Woesebacteria bacterium RIFCSPHIGHO2_01_FULL_37_10]|uniref:Uncharacterized protein n=1 Tax=Candidatus Woesebacteria bacterium RIFCSPHIGHO2_01_FULL_37_10 TaxID=1802489 RepID=A0A1F7XST6_9BACT|nr:MAG: hypothetical protein A2685_03070 [Candidatus Woesebacteria bacterium RIFCSPHIGHO2_01_FULL_37_10]
MPSDNNQGPSNTNDPLGSNPPQDLAVGDTSSQQSPDPPNPYDPSIPDINNNDATVNPTGGLDTNNQNMPSDVLNSPHVPEKYGGKKIIATIFGIVLLVGSVVAGVYLVQRQQQISERAASGKECAQSSDCVLFDEPGNSGTREVPRTISYAYITAQDYIKFEPGDTNNGCYHVIISGRNISWNKVGSGPDCKDVSNVQVWMGESEPSLTPEPTSTLTPTQVPNASPTPISSPSPTATPTQTQVSAQCSEVQAYDTSWNALSSVDLKSLEAGDRVRFTVSGTSSSGTFDKARFTINGVLKSEVTTKKSGTNEFYYEYIIPSGENGFTVKGELHHSSLGWI